MNFFKLIPNPNQGGPSIFLPSLDSIIRIADPKQIPYDSWLQQVMSQAIMPAAMAILLFAFCCALIQEQRRAAVGASDFSRILYSLIFHVAILSVYPFAFGWIVDATHALGDLFLDDAQISEFIKQMYQQFNKWDLGVWVAGIIAYVTYIAAFCLFFLFFLARYMLLSLIFAIGPIVIAFSVWDQTSRFRAWLVGFIQVASWVVVLKFIIAVSLAFSLDKIYNINQTNIIFVIAANILYVVMLWHTPAIASTIIGGASLGFLGTQSLRIATEKTVEVLRSMGGMAQESYHRFTQSKPVAPVTAQQAFNPWTLTYDKPFDPYGGAFLGRTPKAATPIKSGKTYGDAYGSGEPTSPEDDLSGGHYADPYGAGKPEFIKKSNRSYNRPRGEKTYGDTVDSGETTKPDLGPGLHTDPYGSGQTEHLKNKDGK